MTNIGQFHYKKPYKASFYDDDKRYPFVWFESTKSWHPVSVNENILGKDNWLFTGYPVKDYCSEWEMPPLDEHAFNSKNLKAGTELHVLHAMPVPLLKWDHALDSIGKLVKANFKQYGVDFGFALEEWSIIKKDVEILLQFIVYYTHLITGKKAIWPTATLTEHLSRQYENVLFNIDDIQIFEKFPWFDDFQYFYHLLCNFQTKGIGSEILLSKPHPWHVHEIWHSLDMITVDTDISAHERTSILSYSSQNDKITDMFTYMKNALNKERDRMKKDW